MSAKIKNSTLNGYYVPEETWDPLSFLEESQRKEYLKSIQRGSDLFEMDNVCLKTGCVSEAKGSCYIEIGNIKVICSLYGPRDIPKRDELSYKLANLNCEFRFTSYSSPFFAVFS